MASKLNIYSIGQAASDLEYGSWELEVYPLEQLPTVDGDIAGDKSDNVSFKNKEGGSFNFQVDTSNTITASWLSFGDYNRASAPNICKGEYVLLFKYAGEDQYFWMPLFSEFDLRKQEDYMIFVSNKSKQTAEAQLAEMGYYFRIDTINKVVRIHTGTDDNGSEAVEYDMTFNTADGTFSILDSNENSIELDSVNKTLTVDVGDNVTMNFKSIALSNGSDELISLLSEILQAIIDMQHTGNLGAPTQIFPASKAQLDQLKAKLEKFMG